MIDNYEILKENVLSALAEFDSPPLLSELHTKAFDKCGHLEIREGDTMRVIFDLFESDVLEVISCADGRRIKTRQVL